MFARIVIVIVVGLIQFATAGYSTHATSKPIESLIANSSLLPDLHSCGLSTSRKIYGGEIAELDEFPWMALLEFYNRDDTITFECGGSLINNRYVLTAAHCILPSLVGVRLGEYNTDSEIDCITNVHGVDCAPKYIRFSIEKKTVHHGYRSNDTNKQHDIALLRLDRKVEYSDFIQSICLPLTVDEFDKSYFGLQLTVAGWGFTERNTKSSIKLKVNVPVKALSDCMTTYKSLWNVSIQLEAGQICAGGKKGQSSCRGDSGGPLVTVKVDKFKDSRYYAIGLVSFGPLECAQENVPIVYTKISKYVKWIVDQLEP